MSSDRELTTDTFQSLLEILSPLPLSKVVKLFLPFVENSTHIENALRENVRHFSLHAERGTNPHQSPFMFLGCWKIPSLARLVDEQTSEFRNLRLKYPNWYRFSFLLSPSPSLKQQQQQQQQQTGGKLISSTK